MNGEPGENDGFLAVEDPQSSDTTARRHRIATAINLVVVIEMRKKVRLQSPACRGTVPRPRQGNRAAGWRRAGQEGRGESSGAAKFPYLSSSLFAIKTI